ncbi:MAG: hypothetical protein ACMG6S_10645 [Byssovorax sp.]
MTYLQLAYAANVVILLPVAVPALLRLSDVAQSRFEESAGWRVLVGALWTAILVLSALGLRAPLRYAPVLLLQLIYKTLWLVVYAAPRVVRGESRKVPWGIGGSFLAIVLVWPWIIPWEHLLGE